jgi:hypothetical protein
MYRIKADGKLYTADAYNDDGVFISFVDKYGKMIKMNRTQVEFVREI